MSEEMLIQHCSPTLAGLKTGNLFNCRYQSYEEVLCFLRKWNTAHDDAILVAEPVICNDAPDDEAIEACKALGAKLAEA